jgi:hypothetical protein
MPGDLHENELGFEEGGGLRQGRPVRRPDRGLDFPGYPREEEASVRTEHTRDLLRVRLPKSERDRVVAAGIETDVKVAARERQSVGARDLEVYGCAGPVGALPGDGDGRGREIDPRNSKTTTRQPDRIGARPASHVEHARARRKGPCPGGFDQPRRRKGRVPRHPTVVVSLVPFFPSSELRSRGGGVSVPRTRSVPACRHGPSYHGPSSPYRQPPPKRSAHEARPFDRSIYLTVNVLDA